MCLVDILSHHDTPKKEINYATIRFIFFLLLERIKRTAYKIKMGFVQTASLFLLIVIAHCKYPFTCI
jgi:hypothetical protein